MALAAFTNLSALAVADATLGAKTACACCDGDCACAACTCDATATPGQPCDCCGEAECCPASKTTSNRESAKSEPAEKNARTAKANAKSDCDCCGTDCHCESCLCETKAGEACDCCEGAACCTSVVSATAKAKSGTLVGGMAEEGQTPAASCRG